MSSGKINGLLEAFSGRGSQSIRRSSLEIIYGSIHTNLLPESSRNVRFYRHKALTLLFSISRTPPKAVINNTKKINKNNTEIEKLKSENGDLQKPLEANKRLTKQTLEFLKKISELPSPDNPHDIKIRKTQNEKIGRGFKEAKTAFEQLDVNHR